ncbi:MAG TPA: Tn3 family transposase, partial [Pseudonocardiaceae bacterium]|nr:Tn3 family transposase [Pseudonocardiaceae bacterium]
VHLNKVPVRKLPGGWSPTQQGRNLNGLRETVHFTHLGQVHHRQLIDHTAQALCITLVVNCIAAYNAGLLHPAEHRLRATLIGIGNEQPLPTSVDHPVATTCGQNVITGSARVLCGLVRRIR